MLSQEEEHLRAKAINIATPCGKNSTCQPLHFYVKNTVRFLNGIKIIARTSRQEKCQIGYYSCILDFLYKYFFFIPMIIRRQDAYMARYNQQLRMKIHLTLFLLQKRLLHSLVFVHIAHQCLYFLQKDMLRPNVAGISIIQMLSRLSIFSLLFLILIFFSKKKKKRERKEKKTCARLL